MDDQKRDAYLDAAMRLDPAGVGGELDWRHYLAGLAAFGEDRFEDAIRSLKKIDVRSPDPWSKFFGLQVLLSAYGHLGRSAELESAKAEFKTVLTGMDKPTTIGCVFNTTSCSRTKPTSCGCSTA